MLSKFQEPLAKLPQCDSFKATCKHCYSYYWQLTRALLLVLCMNRTLKSCLLHPTTHRQCVRTRAHRASLFLCPEPHMQWEKWWLWAYSVSQNDYWVPLTKTDCPHADTDLPCDTKHKSSEDTWLQLMAMGTECIACNGSTILWFGERHICLVASPQGSSIKNYKIGQRGKVYSYFVDKAKM